MGFWAGTVLAMSIVMGFAIWGATGSVYAGITAGAVMYSAVFTALVLCEPLTPKETTTITHVHQPDHITINVKAHFSRDVDHRFPVYYEK
jgi:hypothetical protein